LFGIGVYTGADIQGVRGGFDGVYRRLEGSARYDAVYICSVIGASGECPSGLCERIYSPERMVWNAPSTFEASSAEVSMNDNPFSAV
jgi:hypothetical protein